MGQGQPPPAGEPFPSPAGPGRAGQGSSPGTPHRRPYPQLVPGAQAARVDEGVEDDGRAEGVLPGQRQHPRRHAPAANAGRLLAQELPPGGPRCPRHCPCASPCPGPSPRLGPARPGPAAGKEPSGAARWSRRARPCRPCPEVAARRRRAPPCPATAPCPPSPAQPGLLTGGCCASLAGTTAVI